MNSDATQNRDIVYAGDGSFAADLRGFGVPGIIAILLILLTGNISIGNFGVPLGAMLVLAWVRWSRTSWSEIGYTRPRSWTQTVLLGIALGVALKLAMKIVVMPLLGASATNTAYQHLVGNRTLLPAAVWAMIVVAGFGEETVFRGFAFQRLGKLLGSGVRSKMLIVLLTSLWFGAAHYTVQGISGVQHATIVGLVYGTIFAATGSIWMLMIAHASFDLVALGIIFFDLETVFAHLLFK
jgi:membrane protease YdiL (CAAX protease family)